MSGTPEGAFAFSRTQGPWQTAATGLLAAAKVWIRAREVGSLVRSNIAVYMNCFVRGCCLYRFDIGLI